MPSLEGYLKVAGTSLHSPQGPSPWHRQLLLPLSYHHSKAEPCSGDPTAEAVLFFPFSPCLFL